MTETVYFPNLGLEFEIERVAVSIGGFNIYWYGVLIGAGMFLALLYVFRRTKEFGLNADRVADIILFGGVSAVICARLYYVIFSWDSYKGDFLRMINTREGGLAIYGGIIGAFIGGYIFSKIRRVKFLPLMDLISGGFFIGQAVGRWGNFINVEAFGSNTNSIFAMTSESIKYYLAVNRDKLADIGTIVDPEMPVHPTFLYESLLCAVGFVVICLYTKHRKFDGELTLMYLGIYGIGRFFIEGLRTDSLLIGTYRVSRLLGLLCFIAAAALIIYVRYKIKKEDSPKYMPLYVTTAEATLAMSGELYKPKSQDEDIEDAGGPEDTEDAGNLEEDAGEDKIE